MIIGVKITLWCLLLTATSLTTVSENIGGNEITSITQNKAKERRVGKYRIIENLEGNKLASENLDAKLINDFQIQPRGLLLRLLHVGNKKLKEAGNKLHEGWKRSFSKNLPGNTKINNENRRSSSNEDDYYELKYPSKELINHPLKYSQKPTSSQRFIKTNPKYNTFHVSPDTSESFSSPSRHHKPLPSRLYKTNFPKPINNYPAANSCDFGKLGCSPKTDHFQHILKKHIQNDYDIGENSTADVLFTTRPKEIRITRYTFNVPPQISRIQIVYRQSYSNSGNKNEPSYRYKKTRTKQNTRINSVSPVSSSKTAEYANKYIPRYLSTYLSPNPTLLISPHSPEPTFSSPISYLNQIPHIDKILSQKSVYPTKNLPEFSKDIQFSNQPDLDLDRTFKDYLSRNSFLKTKYSSTFPNSPLKDVNKHSRYKIGYKGGKKTKDDFHNVFPTDNFSLLENPNLSFVRNEKPREQYRRNTENNLYTHSGRNLSSKRMYQNELFSNTISSFKKHNQNFDDRELDQSSLGEPDDSFALRLNNINYEYNNNKILEDVFPNNKVSKPSSPTYDNKNNQMLDTPSTLFNLENRTLTFPKFTTNFDKNNKETHSKHIILGPLLETSELSKNYEDKFPEKDLFNYPSKRILGQYGGLRESKKRKPIKNSLKPLVSHTFKQNFNSSNSSPESPEKVVPKLDSDGNKNIKLNLGRKVGHNDDINTNIKKEYQEDSGEDNIKKNVVNSPWSTLENPILNYKGNKDSNGNSDDENEDYDDGDDEENDQKPSISSKKLSTRNENQQKKMLSNSFSTITNPKQVSYGKNLTKGNSINKNNIGDYMENNAEEKYSKTFVPSVTLSPLKTCPPNRKGNCGPRWTPKTGNRENSLKHNYNSINNSTVSRQEVVLSTPFNRTVTSDRKSKIKNTEGNIDTNTIEEDEGDDGDDEEVEGDQEYEDKENVKNNSLSTIINSKSDSENTQIFKGHLGHNINTENNTENESEEEDDQEIVKTNGTSNYPLNTTSKVENGVSNPNPDGLGNSTVGTDDEEYEEYEDEEELRKYDEI